MTFRGLQNCTEFFEELFGISCALLKTLEPGVPSVLEFKMKDIFDLFTRPDGSPMEFTGTVRGVDNEVFSTIRSHGGGFNTSQLTSKEKVSRFPVNQPFFAN